jgi:hypothetical protein
LWCRGEISQQGLEQGGIDVPRPVAVILPGKQEPARAVTSHYYLAMARIEERMGQCEADPAPHPGQLLALADSLHAGTLNEAQQKAAQALRTGILALAEQVET